MERVDFYTGLPSQEPILQDPNDMSSQFALNAADTYNYNKPQQPGFMNFPMNPYVNGYNGPGPWSNLSIESSPVPTSLQSPQSPYGQMPYGGFSPQYQNPYQFNMGYGYQGAPMNTPSFGGNGMAQSNPFQLGSGMATSPIGQFNPIGQNVFFNPQPQDKVVHVPGIFGDSGYILPSDIEKKCDDLTFAMYQEMDNAYEKRLAHSQGFFNFNGMNYYGLPYYNSWFDRGIYEKYLQQIRDIAYEAEERRRELNKKLYGCVSSVLGLDISPKQTDYILNGYDYVIPGSTIQEYQNQERFAKFVEIDPSAPYKRADAMISSIYQNFNTSDNMNDWFKELGLWITFDKLEEQMHRNRNLSNGYDQGTYKTFLRKYAQEKELKEKDLELKMRQEKLMKEIKEGNLDNLPDSREKAIEFFYGKDAGSQIINRVNQLAMIANSDNPIEASKGILIPTGPPNAMGTPVKVIADEVESEFNMRRDAFINSVNASNSHLQKYMKGGY